MDDLEILDAYLLPENCPEVAFGLSDLDGFLAAFACCPVNLPVSGCLNAVFGDIGAIPEAIIDIVVRRYGDAQNRLATGQTYEPVFWQAAQGHVIAMDWCEGFMDAVKLYPQPWERLMQTDRGAELMAPILVHILDDHGNSLHAIAQEDLDAALATAVERIPGTATAIYHEIRRLK